MFPLDAGRAEFGQPPTPGGDPHTLVIGGEILGGSALHRAGDRGHVMLLHDILAKRGGDHPDQAMLKLGGQLDLAHGRVLEAIEAPGAGNDHLHRVRGHSLVAVADQLEQKVAGASAGSGWAVVVA